MKRMIYAGSRLITGDQIAIAVLEYCAALADADTAETVKIPILNENGVRMSATLLVGPASQIVAEDMETPFEELVDQETVRLLHEKTQIHRPVAGSTSQAEEAQHDNWTDDY